MNASRCVAISAPPRAVLGSQGWAEWLPTLAPYERTRAAAFRNEAARESYVAAHVLVRRAAGVLLDRDPLTLTLAQQCEVCGGPHGRPTVQGWTAIHVSLSHTTGAVAAAASHAPVGIDVEDVGRLKYSEIRSARVFSAAEMAQLDALPLEERNDSALMLWVGKECLIKLGRATLDELASCDLSQPIADLWISRWRHARNRAIGAVAGAIKAELDLID